ncbi:acyl-CoA dehydrogenase family protein [Apibacter sp. HY039]|uniref:acyl-CoA dehydrogenase family protein n=1 Tax=Apibacter sp. HY039 TaxID=2501476 RepID=UPI000FEB7831|nr:acyl-CoA dehydrogenase family protein [Apibacter sp. HY039]
METLNSINKAKGAAFITQSVHFEEIFIPEDFSEEQKMMRDTVKDFIDKEVIPINERFEKKDYALTEEIMRKIGELGLLSIAVPEQYGGMGAGFVSTMLVCDYISAANGSLSTAFGAHTGIGTMPITLYGTEEQKMKYLPKLASGEWFGAYCLTEPDAGSDANSGKTKAILSEDKKYYKITGQKMWISNAGFAHLFIVFARIENDKNITAFILERDESNGLSFGEEEHKLGIRSSSTRQVFFNETKIPVENILGERNGGFKIAMNALNVGRIKLAAACIDSQRRIITHAIQYANERVQFKTPISAFGAIRKKIAERATSIYVCESGSYRAAKNIENKIEELIHSGASHSEAELKGVEEFAIECSILKVYASDEAQITADEGIQIYGGMGFSEDAPMEASWRDSRIGRIYEGTNEINGLVAIGMLIKRALKGQIDLINPALSVSKELMSIPSFDIPDYSQTLSEEKEMLSKLKKVFLMISGSTIQKYKEEIEKQQHLLLNASQILIQIYMAESAVLRAEKIVTKFPTNAKIPLAMAQLNLFKAIEIIKSKATESIYSFSEGDEQRMLLLGLKRFTKYSNPPNVIALSEKIASHIIEKNEYTL